MSYVECYCGREIRKLDEATPLGQEWAHVNGSPILCYPEEEGELDLESACTAMPGNLDGAYY